MISIYDSFSKEECLKIEKFIINNIDIFEIVFAPMHEIIDDFKNCTPNYVCDCNNHILCSIMYYRLENLKHIYLLQKCIKNNKHVLYNKLGPIKHMLIKIIANSSIKNVVYERSLLTNS